MITSMITKITGALHNIVFGPMGSILIGIVVVLLFCSVLRKILGKFSWIILLVGIIFIANGIIDAGMITSCLGAVGGRTASLIGGLVE